MKLQYLASLLVAAVVVASAPGAEAQFGGNRIDRPLNNPTVSPYINLFRGNQNGPVLNYYGLVRPQLQQLEQNEQIGMNLQGLQMQQSMQQNLITSPGFGYSQMNTTGHPAVFQSFTNGGAALGGGFGGGGLGGSGTAGFGGGMYGAGGYSGSGYGSAGIGGAGIGGYGAGGLGMSGHPAAFGTFTRQTGR